MLNRITEADTPNLDATIARLNSNDPTMTEFHLRDIICNTHVEFLPDADYTLTVSHIRDEDLQRIAEALRTNTTIQKLSIDGSDSTRSLEWTSIGAKAFGEAIKDHPALREVSVDLNTFSLEEKQVTGFLYCLTGSAKILKLCVSYYCITSDFLNEMGELLSHTTGLKNIYLQGGNHKESKEHFEMDDFSLGLSFQRNLKRLSLSYINIGNVGLAKISKALLSTKSLTSLTLDLCQITSGLENIYLISVANPLLNKIQLSNNSLSSADLQALISKFPEMKKLDEVHLRNTLLSKESLNLLVSLYQQKKITVSNLRIDSNDIVRESVDLIIKLIDGNTILKHLGVNFCEINDNYIQQLKLILSNPYRCQLETFSFTGNQPLSRKTYASLLEILRLNELLCDLDPPRHSDAHRKALDINRAKKPERIQQTFINTAIAFCQGSQDRNKMNNNESKASLTSIPVDIIFYILTFLGEETAGMSSKKFILCNQLILMNLKKRSDLILEMKYNPTVEISKNDGYQEGKGIGKWWSQSITDEKNNLRHLFKHNQNRTIGFFSESEEKDRCNDNAVTNSHDWKRCSIM